jgi:hypothetical protein
MMRISLQKVSGEGMPKSVGRNGFAEPSATPCAPACGLDCAGAVPRRASQVGPSPFQARRWRSANTLREEQRAESGEIGVPVTSRSWARSLGFDSSEAVSASGYANQVAVAMGRLRGSPPPLGRVEA